MALPSDATELSWSWIGFSGFFVDALDTETRDLCAIPHGIEVHAGKSAPTARRHRQKSPGSPSHSMDD